MKSGILTTEFWTMIAGQVIAMLVALHVIDPAKQAGLQDASTSFVQSIFALVSSVLLIRSYIGSRATVKAAYLSAGRPQATPLTLKLTPTMAAPSVSSVSKALIAALALAIGSSALATDPTSRGARTLDRGPLLLSFSLHAPRAMPHAACFLPWRSNIEAILQKMAGAGNNQYAALEIQLLQQIVSQNERLIAAVEKAGQQLSAPQATPALPPQIVAPPAGQQAPPQPQIIVLGSPKQDIPLGGPPLQQIPLGGPPLQQIPLGGPPLQQIPLGNQPLQQIPLGNPPSQILDAGPQPQQQIPLTPVPPQQLQVTPAPTPPAAGPTPVPQPKQQIPLGPAPKQIAPYGPPTGTTFRAYAYWVPASPQTIVLHYGR
jgi:hypothetical protein